MIYALLILGGILIGIFLTVAFYIGWMVWKYKEGYR